MAARTAESLLRLPLRVPALSIEVLLATVSVALAVTTILWDEWIEFVFRVEPDRGDGSLERVIAAALLVLAFCFAVRARRTWRRNARARSR
jgi:hypothetical protein